MQRNGQNPIRKTTTHYSGKMADNSEAGKRGNSPAVYICSLCNEKIEPKPGFRLSTLKCKCGGSPVKKG